MYNFKSFVYTLKISGKSHEGGGASQEEGGGGEKGCIGYFSILICFVFFKGEEGRN